MNPDCFEYDDGGRAKAGYIGDARDCVTRAIAIATEIPYGEVYAAMATGEAELGKRRSARDGIERKVYYPYLEKLGWIWVPTMKVGQGCKVHLRSDELPSGRLIVRVTKHVVAVIDGVIHDTHDPSREGTRCVYGYWKQP